MMVSVKVQELLAAQQLAAQQLAAQQLAAQQQQQRLKDKVNALETIVEQQANKDQ